MMSIQCITCKHYQFAGTCEAFPEGIPQDIFSGLKKHNKPIKGQDNNIIWEKIEITEEKNIKKD